MLSELVITMYNPNNIVGLYKICIVSCIALCNVTAWMIPDPIFIISVVLCPLNIYVHSLQVGKLRPGEVLDPKVRFVLIHKTGLSVGIVSKLV